MSKRMVIKTIIFISLIVALTLNNFAAVVSDNDGSAFITNELSAYLIQFNFSKM